MKELLTQIIGLLYESQCSICNKASSDFIVCKSCESEFVIRSDNYIKYLDKIKIYAWGRYEGKLRQGIINLKNGKKRLGKYFGERITELWDQITNKEKTRGSIVIPVPSHRKRIKERGFCQTSLIAYEFAKLSGLHFSNSHIVRNKETKYMNALSNVDERRNNIKDAFEISSSIHLSNQILLIDDILTSGCTMSELAKTIHTKHPEIQITGLTVAAGDKYN